MTICMIDWHNICLLLSSDHGIPAALAGFALVVAGKLKRWDLCGFLGCILVFTAFDLLGYKYAIEAAGRVGPALVAYRIMQFLFQFILILLFLPSSLNVAVGFTLVWWTGGCDILYYLIGKYPLPESFSWLAWTLPGLIINGVNQLFGTKYAVNTILVCAVSGGIFIFYLCWFMKNDIRRFTSRDIAAGPPTQDEPPFIYKTGRQESDCFSP